MTILLPLLVLLFYFYMRKIWFQLRKIKTLASIERIDLGFIQPELILPEVKIHYKYYFQGGVYFGKGYILLSDFLDDRDYYAYFNSNRMVVLETDDEVVVSDEHIESFLMGCYPSAFVYIDPIEPYNSYLEGLNKTSSIGVPS
jgi:hypothetical protein